VEYFSTLLPMRPILGIVPGGVDQLKPEDVLPPTLKRAYRDGQGPLLANATAEGEQTAFLRIAAELMGTDYVRLANRFAEHQREVARQLSRQAAKTHTLPAQAAFLEGDASTALKHALAACIEGNDFTWAEASELEAAVGEYARGVRISKSYGFRGKTGNRVVCDNAELCGPSLLAAGFRNGKVLLIDARTGDVMREFGGKDIWARFEGAYPDSEAHKWEWFRHAWYLHHPLGSAIASPDDTHFLLTHGKVATSWRFADLEPTGLYLGGSYDLFAFERDSHRAALASKEAGYRSSSLILIVDLATGVFVEGGLKVWEPLSLSFSTLQDKPCLWVLSRSGEVIALDAGNATVLAKQRIAPHPICTGSFVEGGRALRIEGFDSHPVPSSYFTSDGASGWKPDADPVFSAAGVRALGRSSQKIRSVNPLFYGSTKTGYCSTAWTALAPSFPSPPTRSVPIPPMVRGCWRIRRTPFS
jgi:hypothetical protein